jgi:hypothetical protein
MSARLEIAMTINNTAMHPTRTAAGSDHKADHKTDNAGSQNIANGFRIGASPNKATNVKPIQSKKTFQIVSMIVPPVWRISRRGGIRRNRGCACRPLPE